MKQMVDKVVIVTGASSGIGMATARELARRGMTVVVTARRKPVLDQLVHEIEAAGGRALAVATDMAKLDELDSLVRVTVEHFGRVDILVNNAGVGIDASVADLSEEALYAMVDTNLLAPIRLARAVIPHMRKVRGGHIVNIGSVAGHIATPGAAVYATTKFGLRGFSDALRRELQRDRIHVSLIAPGFIRTAMTTTVKVPMPGPEAVARVVVGVLQRPRREVVVPGVYQLIVWLHDVAPWLADWVLRFVDRQTVRRGA